MVIRYLIFTIVLVSSSCHVVMNQYDEKIRQIMTKDGDVNEKDGSGNDVSDDVVSRPDLDLLKAIAIIQVLYHH